MTFSSSPGHIPGCELGSTLMPGPDVGDFDSGWPTPSTCPTPTPGPTRTLPSTPGASESRFAQTRVEARRAPAGASEGRGANAGGGDGVGSAPMGGKPASVLERSSLTGTGLGGFGGSIRALFGGSGDSVRGGSMAFGFSPPRLTTTTLTSSGGRFEGVPPRRMAESSCSSAGPKRSVSPAP